MTSEIYVVTGAARGIGLALVQNLVKQGHHVFATARKPSPELKTLADKSTQQIKILELDIADPKSVANFQSALESATDHIDVLINNAGLYVDGDGDVKKVNPDDILKTFDTNAVGPVRVTQALLPLLKKSSRPRVANITSQMGSIDDNSSGGALAYRMSKTALNMFTKNMSVDVPNMVTLSLHPGWVATNMGGERAPLKPEDSAAGLLKLIQGAKSEDSGKFLTYSGKSLPW